MLEQILEFWNVSYTLYTASPAELNELHSYEQSESQFIRKV